MSDPIVIIGAGQAGAKTAESLRRLGLDAPILLYGEERHLPYQRPPLSKKFLVGDIDEGQLLLQRPEFYEANAIEVVTGRRAVRLDPDRRVVCFEDGTEQRFSKAVIATGSSPRRLGVPGADLPGVLALRSIPDVLSLREHLDRAGRVVVIGGGYLGLEAAAVMAGLGKEVTVLEAEDRILKRVAGGEIAQFLAGLHARQGVAIRPSTRVAALEGSGAVQAVMLGSGERLAADLVLTAVGGVANDEIARLSGLACADGVLVDSGGSTGWRDIFAAGDCARFYSRRYGRLVRLESVQNANDQARAVAERIMGSTAQYDPVPWFWSDQFDAKLQIAGLSQGFDVSEVSGSPEAGTFSVSYFRNGQLLAVDAMNDGKAYVRGRKALAGEPVAASERSRRAPAQRVPA